MILIDSRFGGIEMSNISRRELAKVFGFSSIGFAFATLAASVRNFARNRASEGSGSVPIAVVSEIEVGSYKLFRYPTADDPCILLRLGQDRFVAYSQNCTHLSCPVHLKTDKMQLACPCHHGFFNAEDGRPVAGPPREALTTIALSVRKGHIWAEPDQS
jgi:Rieske Fe-S protein